MTEIRLRRELQGSILDIGGGGEGVIGQIYGSQVTAIDNRQEELDEAPDCCQKILMDAEALAFPNGSFDNVTFFYSLMYMGKETQKKALGEAARVLKQGKQLVIWDTAIDSAYPEPFLVELEIDANGKRIHTTYGVVKSDGAQDSSRFIDLCREIGLELVEKKETGADFRLFFGRGDYGGMVCGSGADHGGAVREGQYSGLGYRGGRSPLCPPGQRLL